jgi:hypothetical protein
MAKRTLGESAWALPERPTYLTISFRRQIVSPLVT